MGHFKLGNMEQFREPLIIINLLLPQMGESSDVKSFWIPAFAGMTFLEVAFRFRITCSRLLDSIFKSDYPMGSKNGKSIRSGRGFHSPRGVKFFVPNHVNLP